MTPTDLDLLAADYARAVEARRGLQSSIRLAVLAIMEQHGPDLRTATAAEADAHAALLAAVEARPELFAKPKSRTVAGVKFGWVAGKASIKIPNEADTIARIRRLLPAEQAELLIRVVESVHKPSVLDLSAADLRRLRIEQVPGKDSPFAKPAADAADKLVDLLLAEATATAAEQEAA